MLCFFYACVCESYRVYKNKFLNVEQWIKIKKVIINIDKNSEIRNKINKIIYTYYDDWSYNEAIKFKNFHYYKCKSIPLLELYCHSNLGLIKAIKNYNGKSDFSKYAIIYVKSELYKGLTELYPISCISKIERAKKKDMLDNKNKINRNPIFISYDDNIIFHMKNNCYNYVNYWNNNNEIYEDFWEKINTLLPFERNIIYSKFDYYFNQKVSNEHIAKKFGYSEEYIRLTIKNAFLKIL
jgi:RNA polymerase sigma factor (sigma-70 family)